MLVSGFPRVSLAHLPTRLEHLPRLTEHLGGPDIWIKRDDCTGLATGGNKARKLEFSMGEALERGADTIITVGAVQSNHVRQAAAAACKLGLKCEVLLEHRVANPSKQYMTSGNVLLDRIFGANLRFYDNDTDFDAEMQEIAREVEAEGGTPYIIPGGASSPVGDLGYVACAEELLRQFDEQDVAFDHMVIPSGSAGTHAGLIVGLRGNGSDLPILGIGVNVPRTEQEGKVFGLACDTAEFVGRPGCVIREDIVADCNYVGRGYGEPTDAMNEAVLMLARTEGLLFDPVYTGKALAGLIDYVREGRFEKGQTILFVHTGGVAGLFAYADKLKLDQGSCLG
ncbi:MAG: D-cysteine desulfhydrase [Gammaproteobacteria bacterium]|nr:D-cysteine desulfhydrase [Gammaproteobacteria bacterium]NNF49829.1 D-cysteine desulfhydrase [Woeseiaceae bacterium]MBT8093732.1 D-cysteine desulfhydrase [Gammaproteobacteria bacterium]MBT8105657.1 D-cysteine desulfhydrase [Gammaproteobacteria bacterium]NNK25671.1 D-cysteine desulfhydrase [Woeseiaceae bacterium]